MLVVVLKDNMAVLILMRYVQDLGFCRLLIAVYLTYLRKAISVFNPFEYTHHFVELI